MCLYVDDILIFGSNLNVIEEVKNLLSSNFEMKDLGEDDVILNIKLVREGDGGVTLLQSHYVEKVLSRFGFSDCDPAPTPYDPSMLLRESENSKGSIDILPDHWLAHVPCKCNKTGHLICCE
jgi:hypothetical protein